jgi:hypothetical protein
MSSGIADIRIADICWTAGTRTMEEPRCVDREEEEGSTLVDGFAQHHKDYSIHTGLLDNYVF